MGTLPFVTLDSPIPQGEEGWINLIYEVVSRAETSSSSSQDDERWRKCFVRYVFPLLNPTLSLKFVQFVVGLCSSPISAIPPREAWG